MISYFILFDNFILYYIIRYLNFWIVLFRSFALDSLNILFRFSLFNFFLLGVFSLSIANIFYFLLLLLFKFIQEINYSEKSKLEVKLKRTKESLKLISRTCINKICIEHYFLHCTFSFPLPAVIQFFPLSFFKLPRFIPQPFL